MFSRFKSNRQRENIRRDRKYLAARARRLLKNYLSTDGPSKAAIYELVAGAAAGCQPDVSDPELEGVRLARASAEVALNVVRVREHSAAYTVDDEMQKLGTAAVHLLTIATSYMTAHSDDVQQK